MASFVQSEILGTIFETTTRYTDLRPKELLVSGLLCSAYDEIRQQHVILRKIKSPFETRCKSREVLQEIVLLKQLQHSNLVLLCDIFFSPLDNIYLVSEFSKTNLTQIIGKGGIDNAFATYFVYQILRGLKYLHSAGLSHCDLKPSVILVDDHAGIKISNIEIDSSRCCPIGSRFNHHYQAPEVILACQRVHSSADIFSAGCILGEMLQGNAIFAGEDLRQQLEIFRDILGSPPDWMLERCCDRKICDKTFEIAKDVFRPEYHDSPRVPDMSSLASSESTDTTLVLNLLKSMLVFEPRGRLSAADALAHAYLERYHDPTDEPICQRQFELSIDERLPGNPWMKEIIIEVLKHR
ncbi:MAP kinase SakA [Aspergillus homomorphus CBS 101889]|uniref:MAP kinase SakA n=1 Tax=Aspergillus homomorphus (strain CBS 101889) TaxID=1450537 RepID=A0A395HGG1_ASPHC|nr:MAP kinase SakA [Aspergillus homomorphus CBS 101889]RAL07011.1 MAP kinase SakA [Aspergillus homomorphus CBS 101889]